MLSQLLSGLFQHTVRHGHRHVAKHGHRVVTSIAANIATTAASHPLRTASQIKTTHDIAKALHKSCSEE